MIDLHTADSVAVSAVPGIGIPTRQNLLPRDGEVSLIQDDSMEWSEVMRELTETIPWEVRTARIFGREVKLPRETAWFGTFPYEYSGVLHEPTVFPPILEDLRERAESLAGASFDGVLLNRYRDGQDSVGWHADDEAVFGERPIIASLSVGGQRTFRFRHNETRETVSLELTSGCWLIMAGDTQRFWQHCVPKTARAVEPRINLTFRRIIS